MGKSSNKGLTLIGVIVSLGILTSAVLVLTRSLIARKEVVGLGREKLIAVSVAREGLELVRVLRDNNWLTKNEWTKNICDNSNNEFTLDAQSVRNNDPPGAGTADELFRTPDQEWVHDEHAGAPTAYRRRLAVDCTESAGDPENITVTSQVTWTARGTTSEVAMSEKLFNWFTAP